MLARAPGGRFARRAVRRLRRDLGPALRHGLYGANRVAGRFDAPIWLIGEGRSGTTWLANMINADGRLLERFEPFHPHENPRFKDYPLMAYCRPGTRDDTLETELSQVFRARYVDPWVDQAQPLRLTYRGILVKDVFASLIARWTVERIAGIKPILLMRNPFAVARSKLAHDEWIWIRDVAAFLNDRDLVADHLADKTAALQPLVGGASLFLTHIASWAVVHHVLLRQFARGDIHVVFYEDAVARPAEVAEGIERFLGQKGLAEAMTRSGEPSANRVSLAHEVARARLDPYGDWCKGLDGSEREAGTALLAAFGLENIYGPDGRPDHARLTFRGD